MSREAVESASTMTGKSEFCAATSTAVRYLSSVSLKFSMTRPKYSFLMASPSEATICLRASRP